MIGALAGLLLVAAIVSVRTDPRQLRVGVLGAAAAWSAAVAVLGSEGGAWIGVGAAVVLGVFSVANAVTMLRRSGRGISDQVSLAFGMGVLAWAAAIVALRADWLLVIGAPLAYLGFVLVAFVGYGLVYAVASQRWARPVDTVVVLGAGLRGEDVTPMLAARLDRGRLVLDRSRSRGRETRLICSGGQGDDEVVPEAEAMARYLVDQGVASDLVWLEDASTSTEENLEFSADVAERRGLLESRFAVVTNDFHALRAALFMRRQGLRGYSLGARTSRSLWPSAVLREYAAILWEHRALNVLALVVVTGVASVIACQSG